MSNSDQVFFRQDLVLLFETMAEKRGPGAVVNFIEKSGLVTCPHCGELYYTENGHAREEPCTKKTK